MGKFDYKFVEVPCDGNLKNGNTETLERCKEIIMNEAAQGWRLIQIISGRRAEDDKRRLL